MSSTNALHADEKYERMIHLAHIEKELLLSKKEQVDGVTGPWMKSLKDRYKVTIHGLSNMGENHTDKLGGIMEKKYALRQKYIELQQYLNTRIETFDHIIKVVTSLQKNRSTNSETIEHAISKMSELYDSTINWDIELQVKYNLWSAAFTIAMNAINAAYATIHGVTLYNVTRSTNHSNNHSTNHSTNKSMRRIRFRNSNNIRVIPSRNELKQMELEADMQADMHAEMAASDAFSGGQKRTLRKKRALRKHALRKKHTLRSRRNRT